MLNELGFFREEIGILERQLEEFHGRNTSMQMTDKAEEFRNSFARNRDLITGMENELMEAERKMAIYAKSNETADFDAVNVADHAAFREQYNSFRETYLAMKEDFRKFESGWA